MMNNVKKSFSIRDLENLSGIKAHTIRIWEKRYHLLHPERTTTNIRSYNLASLQKLLNIALLYNHGYKISRIAKIAERDIAQFVKQIGAKEDRGNHAIHDLKCAMINFDEVLFQKTCNRLMLKHTFREVFWKVFIPFLDELGLLWQTDTISPAHEHFISHLIKQKLCSVTELQSSGEARFPEKVFVLFLPENEIHEIGLLFINYELILKGHKTIYLGQTMPIENLDDLQKHYRNIHYISYFTVVPTKDKLAKYITDFNRKINPGPHHAKGPQLWLLGRQTGYLAKPRLPDNIRAFQSIPELMDAL